MSDNREHLLAVGRERLQRFRQQKHTQPTGSNGATPLHDASRASAAPAAVPNKQQHQPQAHSSAADTASQIYTHANDNHNHEHPNGQHTIENGYHDRVNGSSVSNTATNVQTMHNDIDHVDGDQHAHTHAHNNDSADNETSNHTHTEASDEHAHAPLSIDDIPSDTTFHQRVVSQLPDLGFHPALSMLQSSQSARSEIDYSDYGHSNSHHLQSPLTAPVINIEDVTVAGNNDTAVGQQQHVTNTVSDETHGQLNGHGSVIQQHVPTPRAHVQSSAQPLASTPAPALPQTAANEATTINQSPAPADNSDSFLRTIHALTTELDTIRREKQQSEKIIHNMQLQFSEYVDKLAELQEDNIRLVNELEEAEGQHRHGQQNGHSHRSSNAHSHSSQYHNSTADVQCSHALLLAEAAPSCEKLSLLQHSAQTINDNALQAISNAQQQLQLLQLDGEQHEPLHQALSEAHTSTQQSATNTKQMQQHVQSVSQLVDPTNVMLVCQQPNSAPLYQKSAANHDLDATITRLKHENNELRQQLEQQSTRAAAMSRDKILLAKRIEESVEERNALIQQLREQLQATQQQRDHLQQRSNGLPATNNHSADGIDETEASEQIRAYLSSSMPLTAPGQRDSALDTVNSKRYSPRNGPGTTNSRYYTPQPRRKRSQQVDSDPIQPGLIIRFLSLIGLVDSSDLKQMSSIDEVDDDEVSDIAVDVESGIASQKVLVL